MGTLSLRVDNPRYLGLIIIRTINDAAVETESLLALDFFKLKFFVLSTLFVNSSFKMLFIFTLCKLCQES